MFSSGPESADFLLGEVTLGTQRARWQMVKNPPEMWETRVQSLGQEDPLEKEMATHSSILAWETLWTEEPGGPQSLGLQRVRHD